MIVTDKLTLHSNGKRVTYHNITNEVKRILETSEIQNGVCVIQSPHTTCSVIFEEFVHDLDFNGDELKTPIIAILVKNMLIF